jgi:hypothetical protein
LLRARTFLSVGHDEYWSLEMFNHVQAAVAAGVNAAFLSGNSCDGRIEFSAGAAGIPNRALSRIGKFGARDPEIQRFAGKWKEHGPDPATLMGARSTFPFNGTADWTCVNERHWLFEGTGMKTAIPSPAWWAGNTMANRRTSRACRFSLADRSSAAANLKASSIPPRFTRAQRETSFSTQPASGGASA